jgi:hypothetical protein
LKHTLAKDATKASRALPLGNPSPIAGSAINIAMSKPIALAIFTQLIKLARQTLSSAERRRKFRKIDFMDEAFFYPTQLKFFAAGSTGIHQRLIYGGSQSGKTTACQTGSVWVIDSFRMERSSALYHVQRIHSMTRGLKIPIAFPHDGHTHDKGSGLPLATQYRGFGANMMASHAVNHGTKQNNLEPALEEMRELMFSGKLTIAMRSYHRDEDYRVVKQRDDLVSAFRYAVMMRRQGRTRSECDGVGFGNMPFAGQRRDRSQGETARGLDFNLFATGGDC